MFSFFLSVVSSKILLSQAEEKSFVSWMRTNNKFYTGDEYHFRLGLFLTQQRWANEFNRKGSLFTVGLNKFSAYTPAEQRVLLGVKISSQKSLENSGKKSFKLTEQQKKAVPPQLDWRDKNVVNPIKDQGDCGSCWAFSAISTAESAYAIKNNELLSYSEQNLVDCCPLCFGCVSGFPNYALKHVETTQNHQFCRESDYIYTATDDQGCRFSQFDHVGYYSGSVSVERYDEQDLLEKVGTYGVASICMDAHLPTFLAYQNGIYETDECSERFLNHAVNVVGYGSENGVDFWIARNSWGTGWGENGYFRIRRNADNMCGIATEAFVALA
ncbi:Pro-cathepsin H [Tritrichomonas foetus]|uniref:Pro-cathepsin H n=1 Tax=Tritrichomonas foetus TaxID=1144522 RepID=A0A1J4J7S8_9EUKA|nr:Pro-cathepsin H [Tritrichomonas foetus]|eukprot:OHS94721.1 Pro-cathepsin H [Tritrichomonas foetus]